MGFFRHRQSGATGLAHIDRFDCDQLEDVAKKLLHVASTNKEDDQEDSGILLFMLDRYDEIVPGS